MRTHKIEKSLQFNSGLVVNREKYRGLVHIKNIMPFKQKGKDHKRLELNNERELTNLEKFEIIT